MNATLSISGWYNYQVILFRQKCAMYFYSILHYIDINLCTFNLFFIKYASLQTTPFLCMHFIVWFICLFIVYFILITCINTSCNFLNFFFEKNINFIISFSYVTKMQLSYLCTMWILNLTNFPKIYPITAWK